MGHPEQLANLFLHFCPVPCDWPSPCLSALCASPFCPQWQGAPELGLSWPQLRGPGCGVPGAFLTDSPRSLARAGLGHSPACPHLSTSALWLGLVTAAMYCMMCLLASVFPAPLSPAGQLDSQNEWLVPLAQPLCPPPLVLQPPPIMDKLGRRPVVPEITMQVSLDLRFIAL